MSTLRTASLIGAGMAMGVFTADVGATPRDALDLFVWLVYAVVALVGAFCAASVVLAWRHARQSPRWLWATLAGLLLLSVSPVYSFIGEGREMRRFLATAHATRGVVADKYVRGPVHVVVEFQAGGQSYEVVRRGHLPWWARTRLRGGSAATASRSTTRRRSRNPPGSATAPRSPGS